MNHNNDAHKYPKAVDAAYLAIGIIFIILIWLLF